MSKRNKVLLVLGVLLVGIQLVPIPRENPPVTAAISVPQEVQAVFDNSCNDCHSNLTEWPWYSRVAPVSWLVYRDVKKGRDELNFSEWGDYSDRRRNRKLEEIEEKVSDKEMPLRIYVRLHPDAALSISAAETLIDWSRSERAALEVTPSEE